jgi:hypothetical protein
MFDPIMFQTSALFSFRLNLRHLFVYTISFPCRSCSLLWAAKPVNACQSHFMVITIFIAQNWNYYTEQFSPKNYKGFISKKRDCT